jgi:hypothetical protein
MVLDMLWMPPEDPRFGHEDSLSHFRGLAGPGPRRQNLPIPTFHLFMSNAQKTTGHSWAQEVPVETN